MRITSKGQVTIPAQHPRAGGLASEHGCGFHLRRRTLCASFRPKTRPPEQPRRARLVAQLRGSANTTMTTDEIMALTRGD